VDNGNSGDMLNCVVALSPEMRLNRVILRRWETPSRRCRAPVRDCPDEQRHPIRIRLGDRPPVQRFWNRPSMWCCR